MESKTLKRNPDYSASAVMLTNPPQVGDLLTKHRRLGNEIEKIQGEIDHSIPQLLLDQRETVRKALSETDKLLRQAIDEFGSYQNVEYGEYALKQKRESLNYKPELVRQYAPSKVASFVLIESVDSKALDGLLKAGQLTLEQARQCAEIDIKYAYIIR